MSRDPLKLVKFVCVAKAHAGGHSDSSLTIHEGAWAFCAKGANEPDHEWNQTDGLRIMDAMRFTPRQPAPDTAAAKASRTQAPVAPKGRARSR